MFRIRPKWTILMMIISLCCSWNSIAQDCNTIGLVGNSAELGFSDCGVVILSVNDGRFFSPINRQEELAEGNLILFAFNPIDSTTCFDQVTSIELTCLSNLSNDENDCSADFVAYPNDLLFSRTYSFDLLMPDSTLSYEWSFGDGTAASAYNTTHTYQQNGEYLVCLTSSDGEDCQSVTCDSLSVMTPFFNDCGFTIESKKVDVTYQLEVFNPSDIGAYHPQTVEWYKYETGIALSNQPILEYVPTENDPLFINICADIALINEGATTCSATICHILFNMPSMGGSVTDTSCQALFSYLPTNEAGIIEFHNLSSQPAYAATWDFGDGTLSNEVSASFTHTYQNLGLYEACLTIQDSLACTATFCLPIFTVGGEDICAYNECVFPGDTDRDGLVNIFDALPIGLAFNEMGAERPNATIAPTFQAAFNWLSSFFGSFDTKHADCDGNGVINEADYTAINQNYQSVAKDDNLPKNEALPPVTLAFPSDTIEILNGGGNLVEIPVTLSAGSEQLPLKDIQGIALSMGYNASNIQKISNEIPTTSFLGNPENLLQTHKFIETAHQYDIAISQKGKHGVEGFGRVSDFVVIIDLIDARNMNVDLNINDLKVINSKGEIIPVSITTDSIHLTILSIESRPLTTSNEETILQQNISIAPNLITSTFQLSLDPTVDFRAGQLSIYNTLGEQVARQAIIQSLSTIDVAGFAPGVYWVHLQLAAGQLSKQIVVVE